VKCKAWGRGALYNGLYREALPKKGSIFRLQEKGRNMNGVGKSINSFRYLKYFNQMHACGCIIKFIKNYIIELIFISRVKKRDHAVFLCRLYER